MAGDAGRSGRSAGAIRLAHGSAWRRLRFAGAVLLALAGVAASSPAGAVVLRSISVAPKDPTIVLGEARQLTATAVYSDGSTQNVTQLVTWKSDPTRVATVSNTAGSLGLVTAVGAGKAKISASLTIDDDKTTGSTTVTVNTPLPVSITTRPTTKKLEIGVPTQFKATALYANEFEAEVTDQVEWSSTNPTVATVDASGPTKGTVRPLTVGTTTITARDPVSRVANTDGATTVLSAVKHISVEPQNVDLARRLKFPLRAYANRVDGTRSNITTDVEWSSSNPAVATVGNGEAEGGMVKALTDGAAVMSAFDPKRRLSSSAGGRDAAVAVLGRMIELEVSTLTLGVDEEKNAHAFGTIKGGGTTSDLSRTVEWTVTDPEIASVGTAPGNRGAVTGRRIGTTTLIAREPITGIESHEAGNVQVLGAIISIAMEAGDGLVGLGESVQYKLRATHVGGAKTNLTDKCEWWVDEPRIATVDSTPPGKGMVTGVRKGTTTVVASCADGKHASASIKVIGNLTGIEVRPGTYSAEALTERKFHAVGLYDDGNERDVTKEVSWSSSDPQIVSVDDEEERGTAKLRSVGVATLTAEHPKGFKATSVVTVEPGIVSLEVVPSGRTIRGSTFVRMRAQGRRTDQSVRTMTNEATWSSSDRRIARPSNRDGEKGYVFGGGMEGTATITATLENGMRASATVIVSGLLVSFELIPEARTIPRLQARKIEALGRFSDGSSKKITRAVTFSSSNPTVAIVSNDPGGQGVVTAVSRGTARITAKDESSGKAADNPVDITVP